MFDPYQFPIFAALYQTMFDLKGISRGVMVYKLYNQTIVSEFDWVID